MGDLTLFTKLTIISSILFFLSVYNNSQWGQYITKPATTIFITGVAWEDEKTRSSLKLKGLILSLFGDIFLMFEGQTMFLLGLSSFLCAHIFYITLFYQLRSVDKNPIVLVSLLTIGGLYYSQLYQETFALGGYFMSIAVLVYMIVIIFMVYYAILNQNTELTIGAVLFFISDGTIALRRFILKTEDVKPFYVIMVTYYLAQFFIARFEIVKRNYTQLS